MTSERQLQTTHPSVSDWGRRPQLWVWMCCSQVFCFSSLNANSPVRWVDCLRPLLNIFEYGRESHATVLSSAFTDLLQTSPPSKGEVDPLTLRWGRQRQEAGLNLEQNDFIQPSKASWGFERGFRPTRVLQGEL